MATVPRGFSQGFLSFLTLSHQLLGTYGGWYLVPFGEESPQEWRKRQRIETVAHELAHQWWGNKVGWYNYRDQWLSEALADYSAVLYAANASQYQSVYLLDHAEDWQDQLQDTTRDGRTIESLGPVVLGQRLSSSRSTDGYNAIVYSKGSVVFSMLASILKQEALNQMLGELVTRVGNRAIDTPTFIRSLERMSGFDLTTFANQFIYGTGIPEVYYNYRIVEAAGRWGMEGEARMVAPADYRYKLRREGGWDVTRERVQTIDVSNWALLVPFQITLAGAEEQRAGRHGVSRGLGGNLVIRGASTPFSIPLDKKPQEFWFDQRGQVLGYFYCENHEPKRMLMYRAMELEGDEASAMFEQALRSPLLSEEKRGGANSPDKALEHRERLLDARIHLHLARLQLDRGQPAAARIALQEGDYEAAFRESRSLWLSFPHQDTDSLGQDFRRSRWRDGRVGDGEDYAVLAVAAYELGRIPVAQRALEEAEQRGADMAPLRELLRAS